MMTMMISNEQQLLLVWRCLGCGVWVELCLTAANRIRRRLHSGLLRFLLDGVFSVCTGFGLFLFSLAVNSGELRGVMLLSMAVGGYVSHLSFGRLLSLLLDGVSAVFTRLYVLFDSGFQKFALICRKTLKKVEIFYKKHLHRTRFWVYNRNYK